MINTVAVNWTAVEPLLPEMLLVAIGVVLIGLDLFASRHRQLLPWVTVVGCLTVLAMVVGSRSANGFGGMFVIDDYAVFFKSICLCGVIITTLMSEHFRRRFGMWQGEFYSLLIFSTVGMLIMASAADLMTLYLGLELMSLSIYALVGMHKKDARTSEAAVKYFLMGAFASAILLFGVSLIYGLTGTTDLARIAQQIAAGNLAGRPALVVALGLLIAAFSFKVAAAPFHFWTPDVYEGAPTAMTAFMSVGPKAAGFAVFGRVLFTGFPQLYDHWGPILAVLALLTMAVGNITALSQRSIKRMLAYSAIAHAGYALLGLLAGTPEGIAATMSYLFIYLFMSMGAFGILILLATNDNPHESLDDYHGLAARSPLAGALMLVFMFSLTGIPPTGGFIGKFYLLKSALAAGYTLTVIGAVLFSAVSAYYYLRVVRYMYMSDQQQAGRVQSSPGMTAALALALIGTIGLGLFPGTLLNWATGTLLGL